MIFSMLKAKILSIAKKALPYLIIVLASLVSNYFIFYKGICGGDDVRFHLYQIQDLLYGFDHGYFGLSTNHQYMGGFAINNYGFYGPVPHYAAAIVAFLTRPMGGDAVFGLKSIYLLSTVIGGIYAYKLGTKITKNQILGVIIGIFFVYMPYRIFCAVCRVAFAETVAMCFISLIFYAAYSVVHDEKYTVNPYIALVVGAAVVILSHPFTGLMCAIFGVLYFVVHLDTFIKRRKDLMMWISLGVSAILIFCLIGFYLGNAITVKSTDIYRLNDAELDWTTFEHVSGDTVLSASFSGFLNIIWINQQAGQPLWNDETLSSIIMGLFVFIVSVIFVIITDSFIKNAPKNKYYRWAAFIVAGFILLPFFKSRFEIYLSMGTFVLLYTFISYLYINNEEEKENVKFIELRTNRDFYFLLVAIFICLIFIFIPNAWKYVPELFYQCQFPWRLWSICMFFTVMLFAVLLSYLKKYKIAIATFAGIAAMLILLSQGLLEKRVWYEKERQMYTKDNIALVNNRDATYSGAQNEMVPLVLMDTNYVSEYPNSLLKKVRTALVFRQDGTFIYSLEDYKKYNPVFLEGEGSIEIIKYDSPNNSFTVEVTSETALVQFPQIYNDTYKAYNGNKYLGEATNVDGLIAFNLPKGQYTLNLKFVGCLRYRIARPFFYIGLVGTVAFGVLGTIYRYKKEQEPASYTNEEPLQ